MASLNRSLSSFLQGLKPPQVLELKAPVVVSLELTSRCNSFCPGCSNIFSRELPELSTSDWQKIIAQLAPYIEEYRITGGEPTLREDLFKILESLEATGKYYHIFTNGIWENAEKKLKQFTDFAHLASFLFSLHGYDEESHSVFSPRGSWETLLDTIKKAVNSGFTVHSNTVLSRANFEQLEDLVKLGQALGVRTMVFARLIGKEKEDLLLSPEELSIALEELSQLKMRGFPIELGNCFPYCFSPQSASGCLAGITFGTVSPWGEVRPCNHSPLIAGSLLKEEISPIWKGKIMREWREKLPSECLSCQKLTFCPGGCKAQIELGGKDPLIKGPVKEEQDQLLEVNLEEDLCPALTASFREEDFGAVLIKQHCVVPLTRQGKNLLAYLDGSLTLRQLEEKFGSFALSFVYSLYARGFLDFKSS